jgi:imidazolonepropionase-like amidohydrolase
LKLATFGAARIMKKDAELGSIAPGKLADLVLINGNPAQNISDVRKNRAGNEGRRHPQPG